MTDSATQFYRTRDDVLARIRKAGAAVPEVYGERSKSWRPYPELDTIHDAREIDQSEAASMCPAGKLEA